MRPCDRSCAINQPNNPPPANRTRGVGPRLEAGAAAARDASAAESVVVALRDGGAAAAAAAAMCDNLWLSLMVVNTS